MAETPPARQIGRAADRPGQSLGATHIRQHNLGYQIEIAHAFGAGGDGIRCPAVGEKHHGNTGDNHQPHTHADHQLDQREAALLSRSMDIPSGASEHHGTADKWVRKTDRDSPLCIQLTATTLVTGVTVSPDEVKD